MGFIVMKILYTLIICMFFATIAGCQPGPIQENQTLVIGVEAFPEMLDPRFSVDALSSKIGSLLYRGLFKKDKHLHIVPDLAKEYKILDGKNIEVFLADNVYFHNGKKLTALDVQATINSIRDPKNKSPHRFVFDQIEKIAVLSPFHLIFYLKEPFAPFLTALTMGILPEAVVRGKFEPIGTGPFRIGEVVNREKIVLVRHKRQAHVTNPFNKVVFRTIYDDTLRTLELIQGRLDLVQNAIPHVLLPAITKRENRLNLNSASGINFSYMGFNLKDDVLKNLKVRQAIALAINRDEIIQYKLKGMATKATSLLSPDHWAYNPNLQTIPFDVQRAKQLLDEAGYKDPDGDGPLMRFHLVYKTSTKKDRVEMALLIAEHLRRVGIDVEVKSYEWGTLFRDIRTGNFQLFTLTWVGLTEPDIYYYAFHSSQIPPTGANRGYYQNKELDQLVEEGRKILNQEDRIPIYYKVQEKIFNDLPYVPLWYENNYVASRNILKNYELRPDAGFEGILRAFKADSR